MHRWLLLVSLLLCTPAWGQLREESHPELGLWVTLPAAYTSVPIPPREPFLQLVWSGPGQVQPANLAVAFLQGQDGPARTKDYLEQVLKPDTVEALRGGAERYGMRPARFAFTRRDREGRTWKGLLLGWEGPERSVLVIGQGTDAAFAAESKRWRRVADTLRMPAPRRDDRARTEWERHYAKGRYRGEERRIEERLVLPASWSARDTIHYLVLGNVPDDLVLRRIAKDLEILRARLARDLPAAAAYDADAASVVRVCSSREEYLAYGGLPQAVGYFSAAEAELVLYLGSSLEDTLETVYHEAFHQYVFHSTGGVAPQSWFDEGMGEYYAGASIQDGRIASIEALANHQERLRGYLAAGDWRPVNELLFLDQRAYYANADLHYAQGWSLVYFLRTHPEALGRASWSGLLDRYYRTLVGAWSQELEAARPTGKLAIGPARGRALGAAAQAALEGVDLKLLEATWVAWIEGE